ncbi:MAG: flagellar hook assembly protein FlgD [Spirochaetales bacterium]|jgi:flagellar basal-body rod modification protein FlgD|nr:flagellar hook assembly protein FlgD [Spirochaetales bacterium]
MTEVTQERSPHSFGAQEAWRSLAAGNTTGAKGKVRPDALGKEDFLKLLITQLTHQDPTQPMEDREFIAQMTQFTSLEQMTNMNKEFSRIAGVLSLGQAVSLMGKTVDIEMPGKTAEGEDTVHKVSGIVREVAGGESPQLLINGEYYDYVNVSRVRD